MQKKNSKVDDYITRSADFAQPILEHLRYLVHKACPEVEETMKWGMPSFDYKGPFCSMAAFKQHAVFSFWKASLINDPKKNLQARSTDGGNAMGHFGRLGSLKDLPPDRVILALLKQAVKINDEGLKVPVKKKKEKIEWVVPDYFMNAIRKNKRALAVFNEFAYSHKKEYVEWVTEAKAEATREKRMATAIEWMADGKSKNWKYQKK